MTGLKMARKYLRITTAGLFYISIITTFLIVQHHPRFSSVIQRFTYHPTYTAFSILPNVLSLINENRSICSLRSTKRGRGQKVLAVSLFGPKENDLFQINNTLAFLYELIQEARTIYPQWTIRIYHDNSIKSTLTRKLEYQYNNVDFCNMSRVSYMPQKTWRFLPAADLFVDTSKFSSSEGLHSFLKDESCRTQIPVGYRLLWRWC